MKIVIVAPVHAYDDIRVFRKEARTMVAAGHEVILFARTPDGRPLQRDGVTVRPVRYRNRLSRFAQLPAVGHRAWRERADVYHLHNPDTIAIGFALKARGRRVVYDTHEDFRAEILLRRWLPRAVRGLAARGVTLAESLANRCFDAVIVTQEQLLDRLPGATLIGNPPIVDRAAGLAAAQRRAAASAEAAPGDPVVVGYVGSISADRGLPRMLDLIGALNEDLPPGQAPTRLLLIGKPVNDDALSAARQRPEWRFVDYRGELPQEQAFAALDAAHVGLILFDDIASHRHIDPNKIYEYLAVALPFVASDFADWRRRFAGVDVGRFVPATGPVAPVAAAVRPFLGDRAALARAGRAGLDFVWQHYSWQNDGAPALLALLDRVAAD